jgi:class 3 adenylate cyclase
MPRKPQKLQAIPSSLDCLLTDPDYKGGVGIPRLGANYIDAVAAVSDGKVKNKLLRELVDRYVVLEKRIDVLLKNTLPAKVAEEIKFESAFRPRSSRCSILFSDLVGFTSLAERMDGASLVNILDQVFRGFDDLILNFQGTKIKTMGDAYMAVFGAPEFVEDHAVLAVKAGMALQKFLKDFNPTSGHELSMRLGIHSGIVMAGVVGKERMQFDIFGDDVNIAARFESSGKPGEVNISEATYEAVRHRFICSERGRIQLKNKANMTAYFVAGER